VKTMEAVQVQADAPPDEGRTEGSDSYTTGTSSTALRLGLSLRETPQSVTVIPQEVIKDFNLQDVRDILEFAPGVHVQNERNTEAYYFQSRGFDMVTQQDGIPSPNGFGGRGNWSPDSAFIDRVEIIHGAAGLISGAGKPGGVVNLVMKTPGDQFTSEYESGFDTFGGYRIVGDVGGPFGDSNFGGRFVGLYDHIELYLDDTRGKHVGGYGALDFTPGDRTYFILGTAFERIDGSYGAHYGNPTQPDGTLYNWPRELNLGATWAHENNEFWGVFLRGEHSFENGWQIRGMAAFNSTDFDALEAVPGSEGVPVVTIGTQLEGWRNRALSLDLFARGPVELFGRNHELMFGVNGSRRKELQDIYQYGTEALAVIDPETWNPRNDLDPYSIPWGEDFWGNGDRKQYGAFAAGRFQLADPLHFIVGGRMSWTTNEWEGTAFNDESGEFTPYAGITWDFSKHFSAYASYSEIFEPQDLGVIDANGNVLNPIFGENLEVGLKLEAYAGALNGALAIFRLDQTNLALEDPDGELEGVCSYADLLLDPCLQPAGLVRSEGVELSIAGSIAQGWELIGGYTYVEQEMDNADQITVAWDPTTPKHMLHLGGSYTSQDDQWKIGFSARYLSELYTTGVVFWDFESDDAWDDEVPYRIQQDPYTVFGVHCRYKLNKKFEVSLSIENASDKTYLSGISFPGHGQVYGNPRNATLTVSGAF